MYYFDMNGYLKDNPDSRLQYDALKFTASLQGLLNRSGAVLYINFLEGSDEYWLTYIMEYGSLGIDEVVNIKDFNELVEIFKDRIKGVVLWDEAVPATANAAATICGVEGLVPIRYDESEGSLYSRLVKNGPQFPVGKNLAGMFTGRGLIPGTNRESCGSAKGDVYLWAKEHYLDKGLCNPKLMAYMADAYTWKEGTVCYGNMDNTLLANHDYYIANKAFFFDLSPWDDETPNDDRNQPLGTDLAVMKELLLSQYKQNGGREITSVGGFTPWHVKYTDFNNNHCKHDGVPTEWKYGEILSAYNAIMDADAPNLCGMANASMFSRFRIDESLLKNERPPKRKLENKTYILYYMGDYDSAAWLSRMTPSIWNDPARGMIPLMWPYNPNLSDRAPHVFDYVYRTRTKNDFFAAGDSGAGYLNPTFLLEPRVHSDLPSAMDVWVEHNLKYYNRFDLSITGFIINGHKPITPEVQRAYALFSPDGVGHNGGGKGVPPMEAGTVFHPHTADIALLAKDTDEAAGIIYANTQPGKPQFHIFRSILCTPSFMVQLTERIKREHPEHNYEVVDPYTFFDLLKQHLEMQS
jgi:hypothetical protein